jgi:membrane-anchored glycerophosphoryl diester phosphodiesterase (GDPDase)
MAASNDGQGRGKKKKTNKENLIGKIPKENGGKNILFFYFFALLLFPVRRITIPSYLAIRLSTAGRIKKRAEKKKVWTT